MVLERSVAKVILQLMNADSGRWNTIVPTFQFSGKFYTLYWPNLKSFKMISDILSDWNMSPDHANNNPLPDT